MAFPSIGAILAAIPVFFLGIEIGLGSGVILSKIGKIIFFILILLFFFGSAWLVGWLGGIPYIGGLLGGH